MRWEENEEGEKEEEKGEESYLADGRLCGFHSRDGQASGAKRLTAALLVPGMPNVSLACLWDGEAEARQLLPAGSGANDQGALAPGKPVNAFSHPNLADCAI